MPKIFICYRREDSAYPAQYIYEAMKKHYGDDAVVFDVDTIPPGIDFREYLDKQVSGCDILLAVIGDKWLEILKQRRKDTKDFVRIEIQAALEREIPVVPTLVGKASVPSEKYLPPELAKLAYKQGVEARAGADLPTHLKRLIRGLDRLLAKRKAEEEESKGKEAEVEAERAREEQVEQETKPAKEQSELSAQKHKTKIRAMIIGALVVVFVVGAALLVLQARRDPLRSLAIVLDDSMDEDQMRKIKQQEQWMLDLFQACAKEYLIRAAAPAANEKPETLKSAANSLRGAASKELAAKYDEFLKELASQNEEIRSYFSGKFKGVVSAEVRYGVAPLDPTLKELLILRNASIRKHMSYTLKEVDHLLQQAQIRIGSIPPELDEKAHAVISHVNDIVHTLTGDENFSSKYR